MEFNRNKRCLLVFLLVLALFTCAGTAFAYSGGSIDAKPVAVQLDKGFGALCDANFDKYAAYFTKDEFNAVYDDLQGSFGGVGIYMQQDPDVGGCNVVQVMQGLPADKAGIVAGDLITAVDGEDVMDKDSDYIVALIRGEKGSKVVLTVLRADGSSADISVRRDNIPVQSVYGQFLPDEDGLIYIVVVDFSFKTADEFIDTFNSLADEGYIKGLVLDLRNNGGGSLDAAVDLASLFIPKDDVIMYLKSKSGTQTYTSSGGGTDVPMVCLQNGNSASASEIFLACMQDQKRAAIVGEQSFGKGIMQSIYQLSSGNAIRYTSGTYYSPLNHVIHGVGITPDIAVPVAEDFFPNYLKPNQQADVQLAAAVKALK